MKIKFQESGSSFKTQIKQDTAEIGTKFETNDSSFKLDISTDGEYPVYNGNYRVTPKVTQQSLPTKNKVLVDDVTVNEIPFYNVENTSGGRTVFIAKEV